MSESPRLIYASDRLYSRGAKITGICVLAPFNHLNFPVSPHWTLPAIEEWVTENLRDDVVVCLLTEDTIMQAIDFKLKPIMQSKFSSYMTAGVPWYVFRFMNDADATQFKLTWL